jgi:hypothetical protein
MSTQRKGNCEFHPPVIFYFDIVLESRLRHG